MTNTVLIADDEVHARERLKDLLGRFDGFEIVAEAANGDEALGAIITHKPDVAFLDINMPGISVFTSLPSLQDPPFIVFQTAHAEHAAAAFDIDALDYLLKPVRFERLQQTVKRIEEAMASRSRPAIQPQEGQHAPATQLSVTVNGRARVIAVKDVVRISSEEGFTCIYAGQERVMSDRYLNYYEERLSGGRFFRASRTEIINLDQIAAISREAAGLYTVELKNGMKVDVSRRRAQVLRGIVGC